MYTLVGRPFPFEQGSMKRDESLPQVGQQTALRLPHHRLHRMSVIPASNSATPAKRISDRRTTGPPKRPKWSTTSAADNCPTMIVASVTATPRRGVNSVLTTMNVALNTPPVHTHQGALPIPVVMGAG